jgi:tryptophanyl-tRNA synthetase
MGKPVILTGLRANNSLHLGNYLGALLPIIDMAKQRSADYTINLFIPDLHSFTTPIDHSNLQANIRDNIRIFVAAGLPLDNPNVFIYRQSFVPAHSELTWILDCFTGMGEMQRMTQFKDKSSQLSQERVSVGLFNYPVLMAADILLYGASYVPVGDDQTQHLEFTRDIALRMNTQFKNELFEVPVEVKKQHEFFGKDQGLRIRDLQNPERKMSKSDESGKGVIFLTDEPEVARKKIMSAETDSLAEVRYDYSTRPGISNLLDILDMLGGKKDDYIGQKQYGPLKSVVGETVANFLRDFQVLLNGTEQSDIEAKLVSSEQAISALANQRLLNVQKAVGLR